MRDMGYILWPLMFSALVVMALTLWSISQLIGDRASPDVRTKAWIDAILFWGGFALITGVLGTLLGIIEAARSIEIAGEAPTNLVWGGIRVASGSSALGAVILALASLAWFALQLRWRLLAAKTAGAKQVAAPS